MNELKKNNNKLLRFADPNPPAMNNIFVAKRKLLILVYYHYQLF